MQCGVQRMVYGENECIYCNVELSIVYGIRYMMYAYGLYSVWRMVHGA